MRARMGRQGRRRTGVFCLDILPANPDRKIYMRLTAELTRLGLIERVKVAGFAAHGASCGCSVHVHGSADIPLRQYRVSCCISEAMMRRRRGAGCSTLCPVEDLIHIRRTWALCLLLPRAGKTSPLERAAPTFENQAAQDAEKALADLRTTDGAKALAERRDLTTHVVSPEINVSPN